MKKVIMIVSCMVIGLTNFVMANGDHLNDRELLGEIYACSRNMADIADITAAELIAHGELPDRTSHAVRKIFLGVWKAVHSSEERVKFDNLIQQIGNKKLKQDILGEVVVFRRKFCDVHGYESVEQATNHIRQAYEYMISRIAVHLAVNFYNE